MLPVRMIGRPTWHSQFCSSTSLAAVCYSGLERADNDEIQGHTHLPWCAAGLRWETGTQLSQAPAGLLVSATDASTIVGRCSGRTSRRRKGCTLFGASGLCVTVSVCSAAANLACNHRSEPNLKPCRCSQFAGAITSRVSVRANQERLLWRAIMQSCHYGAAIVWRSNSYSVIGSWAVRVWFRAQVGYPVQPSSTLCSLS